MIFILFIYLFAFPSHLTVHIRCPRIVRPATMKYEYRERPFHNSCPVPIPADMAGNVKSFRKYAGMYQRLRNVNVFETNLSLDYGCCASTLNSVLKCIELLLLKGQKIDLPLSIMAYIYLYVSGVSSTKCQRHLSRIPFSDEKLSHPHWWPFI